MEVYWTVEIDGEHKDLECKSKEDAIAWAEIWFDQKWAEECLPNGSIREDEGAVISFRIDDETGEVVELSREAFPLYYESYHGDRAEHGTYWGEP